MWKMVFIERNTRKVYESFPDGGRFSYTLVKHNQEVQRCAQQGIRVLGVYVNNEQRPVRLLQSRPFKV